MGILVSCARPPHAMEMKGVIRILHSGGLETEYMAPLSAKDVLLEFPQHFIFDAGELQSGDPHPVSGKEGLRPGHVYLVVPLSALQSQDIVSLASKLVAFEEDCMHSSMENEDTAKETNSREFKRRLQEFRDSTEMGICDTPELKTAYVNHLLNKNRSMAWRPGLGTIDEG